MLSFKPFNTCFEHPLDLSYSLLICDVRPYISSLDSYPLNLVQKAQEIFNDVRKASSRKGFRRMNGHSTFSGCLISVPRNAGIPTSDTSNNICTRSYHSFRHFRQLNQHSIHILLFKPPPQAMVFDFDLTGVTWGLKGLAEI